MYKLPETCSVTEFRDNIAEKIKRIRKGGQTTVLTHNGKTAVVVMGAKEYEALMTASEREALRDDILQGREDYRAGRYRTLDEVDRDMRAKFKRLLAKSKR